jgi:serine/threonine protein kinase
VLEPGSILQGRYIIERVLGQGGMATVYLARHAIITERLVAVKETVLPTVDQEERARVIELFNKEARLLARLEHPSLVQVSDFFQEGDSQFLVMTFVDGQTLDHVVGEREALPPQREVLQWAEQIADVLHYMHSQSPPVIYRDLKPSNMMLDRNGKIWILDFGIAREAEAGSKTATQLKGFGTPGYAPPEQFGRTSTDARSDIYALGATLYALLSGERPPVSVDLMMGDATLTPPSQLNPEITAPMERAILRMMALKKDERYQSMSEVREVLRSIPTGEGPRGADRSRSGSASAFPRVPPGGAGKPSFPGAPAFPGSNPTFPRAPAFPTAPTTAPSFPAAPSFPMAPTKEVMKAGASSTLGSSSASSLSKARASRVPTTSALPRVGPGTPNASVWTPTAADILPEGTVPFHLTHAEWLRGIAVFAVCLAFAIPCALGPRPGYLFFSTLIAYPLGHLAGAPFPRPLSDVGGLILQFALPLALAVWLTLKRQPFWGYLCMFIAAQGLVTLGVSVAAGASSGMALDWKTAMGLSTPAHLERMGEALRTLGLFAMLSPLWFMLVWIWQTRPRPVHEEAVF